MESEEVEQLILGKLADAEIEVEGADCNFSVTIISSYFEDLLPLHRQKTVLGLFSDQLATGALHALTIKTYTPLEWNNRLGGLLQISP